MTDSKSNISRQLKAMGTILPTLHDYLSSYNKSLLTISTAGIGFTLVVISQIVGWRELSSFALISLAASWLCYAICIFSVIRGHEGTTDLLFDLELFCQTYDETSDMKDEVEKLNRTLNRTDFWGPLANWTFGLGILLTMVFSASLYFSLSSQPMASAPTKNLESTISITDFSIGIVTKDTFEVSFALEGDTVFSPARLVLQPARK